MPLRNAGPKAAAVARGVLAVALALLLQGCPKKPKVCSKDGFNCMETGCCFNPEHSCYARDSTWATCKASCTPSFSNACNLVGEKSSHSAGPSSGGQAAQSSPSFGSSSSSSSFSPAPPPPPAPISWVKGTWTSAYWDCCKPGCAEKGKGDVDYPVSICHAETGKHVHSDTDSVCEDGSAGMCPDQQPFEVNSNLSMGFASLAASGKHGLSGDGNCGQCYELLFTDEQHKEDGKEPWGGAHPKLVGKRMVVQVVDTSYESQGDHSFDILIPGSGQRAYESGCMVQYPDYVTDDFDCGLRYGGCRDNSSCAHMPEELQAGCAWHHQWYRWLSAGGKTNLPFVKFRRVQCPDKLTSISGSTPNDDYDYPLASESASFTG